MSGPPIRVTLCLALAAASLSSCLSLDRLFRNSPLSSGTGSAERVNLWPLYYRDGDRTAFLWPLIDVDGQGFALRPVLTKDGADWEFLPPIAWWDTASGDWVFVPAYRLDGDHYGLVPLFGVGETNYVGPVYWETASEGGDPARGLFPIVRFQRELSYIAPVWWGRDGATDEIDSYGVFPLFDISDSVSHVGPVFWGDAGELGYLIALPLFGYAAEENEDGSPGAGTFVSLLGGHGWDAAGETTFWNVLGPVYHFHRDARGGESTAVLWPLYRQHDGPGRKSWSLYPLAHRARHFDADGELQRAEAGTLGGLVEFRGVEQTDFVRIVPLFSYGETSTGVGSFADYFSLFGRHYSPDGSRQSMHVGTPLLFQQSESEESYQWSSLLGLAQYESDVESSDFRLLWYLYRHRSEGARTRRDFFPFVSLDTDEDSWSFSFLWRFLHFESDADGSGGHFLFIPWGDV